MYESMHVEWLRDAIFDHYFESEEKHVHLRMDIMEASEVSCPDKHRERSVIFFRIDKP